jgi:sec-independent protein translocase protein TatB
VFGIAWSEILLIVFVTVLVARPEDIPKVLYTLGRIVRRLHYVRYAFTRQFEEFLKEHDLDELRRGVNFEAPEYDEEKADGAHHAASSPSENNHRHPGESRDP